MELRKLSADIGKGLIAGVIGTAAMTVSSTLEMKIRHRPPSNAPANAVAKVFGISPKNDEEKAKFSNLVHWSYGTAWGSVRGILDAMCITGRAAMVAHFALIWGIELIMLPALKVVPPVKEWGAKEIGIDAFHHLVYVAATDAAYRRLS